MNVRSAILAVSLAALAGVLAAQPLPAQQKDLKQRIREELESKKQEVSQLEKENRELQEQLGNLTANASNDWANERQENATLRERINDMAAHIASLSASMEGDASPIPKLVESPPVQENDKPEEETQDDVEKPVGTLADRIRAIQAASEKAS